MKLIHNTLKFALVTGLAATAVGFLFTGEMSHGTSTGMKEQKAQTADVKIDNFSFVPGNLTVLVGTKVTWTNRDDVPHTVVSANQKFKSKALDTDENFIQAFDQPGTYEYFCSLHPRMVAKITVEAPK